MSLTCESTSTVLVRSKVCFIACNHQGTLHVHVLTSQRGLLASSRDRVGFGLHRSSSTRAPPAPSSLRCRLLLLLEARDGRCERPHLAVEGHELGLRLLRRRTQLLCVAMLTDLNQNQC